MTKEEIKIQIALGTYLPMKWKESKKLVEEADNLLNKGCALYEDAIKEVYGDREVEIDWITGEVELL